MKPFLVSAALLAASAAFAADEAPPAKPEAKESMKALMLEDAKRKAAEAATKAPAASPPTKSEHDANAFPLAAVDPTPIPPPEKPAEKKAEAKAANAKAATQPAAVLPKVEVKKARITVLDVQLQEQQRAIEREKKLATPTELDKALNDSKVSKSLSILGGQSADYRANLAKERVSMMQDEADIIEAIAHTKSKEEKAELQKQLDELRAYRRDLEKSLR